MDDRNRKRGRPAKPTVHPVGARMRARRESLGLTVRALAVMAGLRESSASYLSQLESGAKAPHPDLACRLAQALGDDPGIYRAWAATGRRSDPVETARAVRTLAETLRHPMYFTGGSADRSHDISGMPPGSIVRPNQVRGFRQVPARTTTPHEISGATMVPAGSRFAALPEITGSAAGSGPEARLLVPEIGDGCDPGEAAPDPARVVAVHRLGAGSLAGIEPPVRPFALRVPGRSAGAGEAELRAGDLVILTRRGWPLEPFALCAVRLSGHLALARVAWNGRQLLLVPGPDGGAFAVLDCPDRAALERRIAGRAVARIAAGAPA